MLWNCTTFSEVPPSQPATFSKCLELEHAGSDSRAATTVMRRTGRICSRQLFRTRIFFRRRGRTPPPPAICPFDGLIAAKLGEKMLHCSNGVKNPGFTLHIPPAAVPPKLVFICACI
jgi:hypothetical protein